MTLAALSTMAMVARFSPRLILGAALAPVLVVRLPSWVGEPHGKIATGILYPRPWRKNAAGNTPFTTPFLYGAQQRKSDTDVPWGVQALALSGEEERCLPREIRIVPSPSRTEARLLGQMTGRCAGSASTFLRSSFPTSRGRPPSDVPGPIRGSPRGEQFPPQDCPRRAQGRRVHGEGQPAYPQR
jgi:hypothetical protein